MQTATPTITRLQSTTSVEDNLGRRYDRSPAGLGSRQTPQSLPVKRTTLPFSEVRSTLESQPPYPIRLAAIANGARTANAFPHSAVTYSALPPLPAAVAVKPNESNEHYCKLPSRIAPFKHIASPLRPSAATAGLPYKQLGPTKPTPQTAHVPHGLSPYKLVLSEARQCVKHRPTGCLPHTYKPESFAYPSKQGDFSVPYGHHNPIFRSGNVHGPRRPRRQGKMMRAHVDKTPGLTRRLSDDLGREVKATSCPPIDAVSRCSSQSSTVLTDSSRATADHNNLERLRRKYPVSVARRCHSASRVSRLHANPPQEPPWPHLGVLPVSAVSPAGRAVSLPDSRRSTSGQARKSFHRSSRWKSGSWHYICLSGVYRPGG